MSAAAILLAAGRGERLGGELPKAFLSIAGRTLLEWAVAAVDECPDVDAFLVAVPPGQQEAVRPMVGSPKLEGIVAGGPTRQASVAKSLEALPSRFDVVVCHDVARPLAGAKLFSAVIAALDDAEGAIPVIPIGDTVKRVRDGAVEETLLRDGLAAAQTPQAFRRMALERAHESAEAATDDAALLERAGFRVVAIPGDPRNLKVTRPEDLVVAEALLRADA